MVIHNIDPHDGDGEDFEMMIFSLTLIWLIA
jgi:hypothetical protein